MSKDAKNRSTRSDIYEPTSYFFNEKRWVKQERNSKKSYRDAGVVIGSCLRKVDENFQSILRSNAPLSEAELLIFQASYTALFFNSVSDEEALESFSQILESISDGTALLLRNTNGEYNGQKSIEYYESLLSLAVTRQYLEEKWKSVSVNRLDLHENLEQYFFDSIDPVADFGEKIAISRFGDHLMQISLLESGSKLTDPRIKKIPKKVQFTSLGIDVSLGEPDTRFFNQSSLIFSQVSYFYREIENIPFKDFPSLTLCDLGLFWLLFSRLAECVLTCLREQTSGGLYGAFSKQKLTSIFLDCADIDRTKAEQLIILFTNSRNELNKDDLYIKPLYLLDDMIHLCLPSLVTGQFTRVADYFIDRQVIGVFEDSSNLKKGWLFEHGFTSELSSQISRNSVLKNIFCKVLKVSFKRKPGKNNEEIDIILRIGQTYLIVEAKSFIYRTGVMGFHNTYQEFKDSKLGQKKQFFIDDYVSFREKHDVEAQFEFDPTKVVCCYLSSVPHCVGTKINGFPVVDSSILERYFGNSHFLLRDSNDEETTFWFYKNGTQAEKNLKRYLEEPPQLSKYKTFFKYSKEVTPFNLNGKSVVFSEPMFDLNYDNELKNARKLWELAEHWYLDYDHPPIANS